MPAALNDFASRLADGQLEALGDHGVAPVGRLGIAEQHHDLRQHRRRTIVADRCRVVLAATTRREVGLVGVERFADGHGLVAFTAARQLQRARLRLIERKHTCVVGTLEVVGEANALKITDFVTPRARSGRVAPVAKEDARRDQNLVGLLLDR